jgi:hypothetical protein
MIETKIYSKIQILIKDSNNIGTTKIEFYNCSYKIVSNFFIIIINYDDDSTTNKIFNMNEIDSFKTEK